MGMINNASGVRAGSLAYFAASSAPAGYVKANGAAVSRSLYAGLFAAIGTTFGAGDGSTTFNLPDMRGEFVRGFDDGRGVDSGRVLGTAQAHDFAAHGHGYPQHDLNAAYGAAQNAVLTTTGQNYGDWQTRSVGGTETRPRNVALLACIKY